METKKRVCDAVRQNSLHACGVPLKQAVGSQNFYLDARQSFGWRARAGALPCRYWFGFDTLSRLRERGGVRGHFSSPRRGGRGWELLATLGRGWERGRPLLFGYIYVVEEGGLGSAGIFCSVFID